MAQETGENLSVLFVAEHSATYGGIVDMLQQQGYEVYNRDTAVRAFQLLTIYPIKLIIVGPMGQHVPSMQFVRSVRSDPEYTGIPILMIAEEGAGTDFCVEAFENGADDYVEEPYEQRILMARINRLCRRHQKAGVRASMSVHVQAEELPSVLQFLQTEQKTGKLDVKSGQQAAIFCLSDGRLVSARAPYCENIDAVTEVLSWPDVSISFREQPLMPDEFRIDEDLTGVVMNCCVQVDEFHEVQRQLPPEDAMFLRGPQPLPADAPRGMRAIHEAALAGGTIDELIHDHEISQVQATLWLKQLIDEGQLRVGEPPFAEYLRRLYANYRGHYVRNRLADIREPLLSIPLPLPEQDRVLPIEPCDWLSPAPRIIVTGDDPGSTEMFIQTITELYAGVTGKRPSQHTLYRGIVALRLNFKNAHPLDIVTLPGVLDDHVLRDLDEYLEDACAVLMLVTNQDHLNTRVNMRLVRQLRQHYTGVYFFACCRIKNADNQAMFKVNCMSCNYKLSVNMDEAGLGGECPVCGNEIVIPDPMEHLVRVFSLPDEVPVVLVKPNAAQPVRDLLMLLVDNVLQVCEGPQTQSTAGQTRPQTGPDDLQARSPGERPAPAPAPEPQQPREPLPEDMPPPGLAGTQKLILRSFAEAPDDENQDGDDAPAPPAENARTLSNSRNINLKQLLQEDDDDFDVDEFIDMLKG